MHGQQKHGEVEVTAAGGASRHFMLRRCIRALLPSIATGMAATSLLLGSANIGAAEAQRTFDIRSTELSRALLVFSQQSDLVVVAAADLVADRPAPVVSGTMTPEEAISRLLRGSGLQYVKDNDGTIRIVRADALAPAGATPVGRNDLQTTQVEEIVVTGSHIGGPAASRLLPVTVRSTEDIAAVGVLTADQLIASLPQAGGQNFNNEQQGPNQARGDVASANLRGLGSGNTLVLLNGRRMVMHPTTQQEDSVPVQIVNVNTIAPAAVSRLELLRDGAAAIYGADATAGVLNYVLDSDFEGLQVGARYGFSEGTEFDETSFDVKSGFSLNEGRTHVALFGSYMHRAQMMASERSYAASNNRSGLVDPKYAASFNDSSTYAPWLRGRVTTAVTGLGASFTQFHVQPCSLSGSDAAVPGTPDACIDGGSSTLDASLRTDEGSVSTMTPESNRFNLLSTITHEFDSGLEAFGELLYYGADSTAVRGGSTDLTSAPLTVAANNPYNPFGSGPGRLPGYTGPAQRVQIVGMRVVDAGNRRIEVESQAWRVLSGLRGDIGNWNWETAALYSAANTEDVERNRISNTALQAALNSSNPATAYNPFNGGDPNNPAVGDTTWNPASVTDPLRISVTRDSTATLALADMKISSPAAFTVFDRDIGVAVGAEWRRETYEDDRDPRIDGTINFVTTSGLVTSDVMNTSPTPDTEGSRNVTSAYVEWQVPLVVPEQGIPLVRAVNTQLAARYERFSDIEEDVTKPKAALTWEVTDWLRFRGGYSEGFRAPNLEQINATEIRRVEENLTDLYLCALNQGVTTIAAVNQSACGAFRYNIEDVRRGGDRLKPEDSETISYGVAIEPLERLTLTVDFWRIEQTGLVGVFTATDHLNLDAVRRLEQGGSDPALERNASGQPVRIYNEFLNLNSRIVRGVDVSVAYDFDTPIGEFHSVVDVSRLTRFEQSPSSQSAELIAAGLPATAGGSLLERDDNPRTRASATLSWRRGDLGASVFARYVGEVKDSSALNFPVDDWLTFNVASSYTLRSGWLDSTTVRLGVNNVLNEEPPLADEPFGYYASLHDNRGRYWYLQLTKSFE
jgi:outer membrane receptor protein involved in Fe transport